MSLSDQQAAVVEAFGNSINIAAGAGTGKTFTLTERIVRIIERMIDADDTDTLPTQGVVAITFTKAAASELRSRVKRALLARAERDETGIFLRCALDIDNAWISTIHGMAARILRENALEFGISPAFSVIDEATRLQINTEAFEHVLADDEILADPLVRELLHDYPLVRRSEREQGIQDHVEHLLDEIARLPRGCEDLDIPLSTCTPRELIAQMMDSARAVCEPLALDIYAPTDTQKARAWGEEIDQALVRSEQYLAAEQGDSFIDESFDRHAFIETFYAFPPLTNRFGKGKETELALEEYRYAYRMLSKRALCGLGARNSIALKKLARAVLDASNAIKEEQGGVFDQGDLLMCCNTLLGEHTEVCARYQAQFIEIMVDEFQDTDSLQMQILRKIARSETASGSAEELANVCTVGDMQQSIYRFRGGDVRESIARKRELAKREQAQFELTNNYRTHGDILRAVEVVFDREGAFGSGFLKLDACCSNLDPDLEVLFHERPRVVFDLIHYGQQKEKGGAKIGIAEARRIAAKRIAEHFRWLYDHGVPQQNMALLLGMMPNSDVYAKALRDVGLSCMITGGSVFSHTRGAELLSVLLRFGANPHDGTALLNTLLSDLFDISDDALLACAFDPAGKRRSLATVFFKNSDALGVDRGDRLSAEEACGLRHAYEVLSTYLKEVRRIKPSRALRHLLVSSGLLGRLEQARGDDGKVDAEQLSMAADIAKGLSIVEAIERDAFGISDTAARFEEHLVSGKEAPGLLAAESSGCVNIMTIHASKGLEFDHVAVAELKGNTVSLGALCIEQDNDHAVVSFIPPKSAYTRNGLGIEYDHIDTLNKFDFPSYEDEDGDVAEEDSLANFLSEKRYALIREVYKTHEEAEARRLLYVAMTRAKETLMISLLSKSNPEKGNGYGGIFTDMYEALIDYFDKGESGFDTPSTNVQLPICVHRLNLFVDEVLAETPDEDALVGECGASAGAQVLQQRARDAKSFIIPCYEKAAPMQVVSCDYWRRDMWSYSSLAEATNDHGERAESVPETKALQEEHPEQIEQTENTSSHAHATDLGSAFHLLAERAILTSGPAGEPGALEKPDADAVASCARLMGLDHDQTKRLEQALDRWFASSLAKQFAQCRYRFAELPFAITLEAVYGDAKAADGANGAHATSTSAVADMSTPLPEGILEGEIDGLATDDGTYALLIDYKTGGSDDETEEALQKKHQLQAQCYALALLRQGFTEVDAHFVRVERERRDGSGEPAEVVYSFTADDEPALARTIGERYYKAQSSRG